MELIYFWRGKLLMNYLKKIIFGLTILILSISSSSFAGDIDYPVPCSTVFSDIHIQELFEE